MKKVNLEQAFSSFSDHWNPRLAAELNGQHIRLAKLKGEFFVVPRGVEHLPVADEEVWVLMFEPVATLNTGNVRNERTRDDLETLDS